MTSGRETGRRVISGVLLAALCAACTDRSQPPAEPAAAPPPAAPQLPTPPAPLDRGGMLAAVADVASATTGGTAYPPAAAELDGRRFALRLPFGCQGPGPEGARLAYAFDAQKRTLRLVARPEAWTDTPWANALAEGQDIESVEGFWLSRPWTSAETCPAIAPGAPVAAPSPETVGLAQAFAAGGSRLLRRGDRPYEATRKVDPDTVPGVGGFRLALEGRIVAGPGKRPIACRSEHPDRRPVCLVRVELDRVAFEDAGGETLAEWRS